MDHDELEKSEPEKPKREITPEEREEFEKWKARKALRKQRTEKVNTGTFVDFPNDAGYCCLGLILIGLIICTGNLYNFIDSSNLLHNGILFASVLYCIIRLLCAFSSDP
jgi:hypothetical protein